MTVYRYTGEGIPISADTTLRFVAVAEDGTISDLYEESYEFYTDAVAVAPSLTAQATLTTPSVSGQESATVSVPSLTALATFTPPSVVVVPAGTALVSVPSFNAAASFSAPTVTAQQQSIVPASSFTARATYTPPTVTATTVNQGPPVQESATVSVPPFSATAVLIPPTVTANTVSSGSIRGPDGTILDLRDIYGNAITLLAA